MAEPTKTSARGSAYWAMSGAPLYRNSEMAETGFTLMICAVGAHSKPNGTTRLERLRNFTWNGRRPSRSGQVAGRYYDARETVSRQYGPFSPENRVASLTVVNQKARRISKSKIFGSPVAFELRTSW